VATGTPEAVAANPASYTGAYLAPLLKKTGGKKRRTRKAS
jgi:excinuclease ABC subunit A